MSTTSLKRHAFPARYRRKDARTAIYAAVYGPGGKAFNSPPSDTARHLLPQHDWHVAKGTVTRHWQAAAFAPQRAAQVVFDFNRFCKGAASLSIQELNS